MRNELCLSGWLAEAELEGVNISVEIVGELGTETLSSSGTMMIK